MLCFFVSKPHEKDIFGISEVGFELSPPEKGTLRVYLQAIEAQRDLFQKQAGVCKGVLKKIFSINK